MRLLIHSDLYFLAVFSRTSKSTGSGILRHRQRFNDKGL